MRDHLVFISSSFRNLFCRLVGSRLCDCYTVLHDCNEWSLSGRLHDSKAQDPCIYRNYGAQICAPSCTSGGGRESHVLRSLFYKFKTPVSFPEAAAFAWLDQADLGLSRRPRPSPLDSSSNFSRNLQHQRRSPEAHRKSPRRACTQSRRIRTAPNRQDYSEINTKTFTFWIHA